MAGPAAPSTARPLSYWLDRDPAAGVGEQGPVLRGNATADIAIVGAGFTGLWTALALTDPTLAVRIVEADEVGAGASGRNGGFVEPSLTHGLANGRRHFPDENDELTRLGHANFGALLADADRFGVADAFERTGGIDVATAPWQAEALDEDAADYAAAGEHHELLDAEAMRAEVDSPTCLAGLHRPDAGALVHPGRLVRALAREARRRGVVIHEHSRVTGLEPAGSSGRVRRRRRPAAGPGRSPVAAVVWWCG